MLRAPLDLPLPDHVDVTTPIEAVGYIATVALWLAGVAAVIVIKFRMTR